MSYQAMKRLRGNWNTYYKVEKKKNLWKATYCAILTDIMQKAETVEALKRLVVFMV